MNSEIVQFLQHVVNGMSLGSIYALIALGYTMVFGILQLINFAHSDVFMIGAYVGLFAGIQFGVAADPSFGGLVLCLVTAMIACAVLGFFIERYAYRPLRKAPRINVLITAMGVSLFLQYAGQIVFTPNPRAFPALYAPEGDWSIGEVNISPLHGMVFLLSIVLMVILQFIIFKTRLGRGMRAVSFNHDLASLMGIPTDAVVSYTFMMGSALAGAAGVFVGLIYPKIDPLMGVMLGLKAFVAAVFGGIGNITGAVVGALTLGLSEEFVVAYLAPTFRDALAFTLLILVLLFKPTGLFGTSRKEKV